MLDNIHGRDDLRTVARRKRRMYEMRSTPRSELGTALEQGWTIIRKGKHTARIRRDKEPSVLKHDRIWATLYLMEFTHLSGEGGALLSTTVGTGPPSTNTLDVLALDAEVALAIQSTSTDGSDNDRSLQDRIADFASLRSVLSREFNRLLPEGKRRAIVMAIYTDDDVVTDQDRTEAAAADVILLDHIDINYYTALTGHLGPAARYQFLSDLVPGKAIPGLAITVPAVRSRMGGHACYTFSLSPEYLLKISYVSHRAKGKPSDVDKYQRMVNKSRLKRIARYISEDGIFPTNIVVNIDKGKRGRGLRFERARQDDEGDQRSATIGWLTIAPAYKTAWIIDGQHRLYAYSGHPRAARSVVAVLAFENLPPSQQAQLFIDINARQKSVKQSLLQELYAELHWDSEDAEDRTSAVISKAIQTLGRERDSPFHDRILLSDSARTPQRCISLTSMFSALERTGFFYRSAKRVGPIDPGPLWTDDNDRTLRRTIIVLKSWFRHIEARAGDWWALGADAGGGLAMNDGVTVCLNVLKSVFDYLESADHRLVDLDVEEVLALIQPFASELGSYLAALTPDERRGFRALRGIQGQTAGMRQAQAALRRHLPEFNPSGLQDFLERERARTNEQGQAAVRLIESMLQRLVMEELRENFTATTDEWWYEGVPESVRKAATERMEGDKNQRGGREYYFNLVDYRNIAVAHWSIFQKVLAYGEGGNMNKRTQWLYDVNNMRNKVMHASSGVSITQEQLSALHEYENWLAEQVKSGGVSGEKQDADMLASTLASENEEDVE